MLNETTALAALVVLTLAAIALAVAADRVDERPGAHWSWAWTALFGAGLGLLLAREMPWVRPLSLLLASIFPAMLLAGALAYAGRRVPSWLPSAGLGIGILRAAVYGAGFATAPHWIALAVEPAMALAAAGFVVEGRRRAGRAWLGGLIAAGLAGVALLDLLDAWLRSQAAVWPEYAAWLVVALPLAVLQTLACYDRVRTRAARAEDEREAARHALLESEQRVRAVAENAHDLILETDPDGSVRYASPSVRALLELEPEALVGRNLFELVHPDDLGELQERRQLRGERCQRVLPAVRVRHRNGSWRWIEATTRSWTAAGGEPRVTVVGRDVTQRMRAIDALRTSEERLRQFAEHSNDLLAETGPDGRLTWVSGNFERVLGHKPADLVGLDAAGVARLLAPDGAAVNGNGNGNGNGQPGPRGPFGPVARVRDKWGRERILETETETYQGPDGQRRAVSISRDVTQRVRLGEQLQDAQRIESLGGVAAGVAHDFNNLLTPILANASLARARVAADRETAECVDEIQSAAVQAAERVRELLLYAGRARRSSLEVDLSQLARGAAQRVAPTLPGNVRLEPALADDLAPVAGDAAQLEQAIAYLLENAVQAVGDQPSHIRLRTASLQAERALLDSLRLGAGLPEGPYVELYVADDGCGMDDDTRARMFEPFYTTRPGARGLGLAAVLGIMRSHGGALDVDSAPGQGTRIRVLLPAVAPSAQADEEAPAASGTATTGRPVVLLVDDEAPVRHALARMLAAQGFEVETTESGEQALARLADGPAVHAVLLDATMPAGLNGLATLTRLRERWPKLPVLLMSGFGEEDLLARVRRDGCTDFIGKPFSGDAVAGRLTSLIASR